MNTKDMLLEVETAFGQGIISQDAYINIKSDILRMDEKLKDTRFQAACAALSGYRSRQTNATPKEIAQACRMDADALIAELNRTASDAEKGGEG